MFVYWSCLLMLELIYYNIFLTISCVCPLIAVCTLCHFMRGLPSFIYCEWSWGVWMSLPSFIDFDSSWGVSRRAILFDCVWQAVGVGWRAAGGYPHRFSHNNFSSLYRIFTKLGHDSPVKGKNPIYFGYRLGMRITYFRDFRFRSWPLPVMSPSVAHAHAIISGSSTSTNKVL